jgi:dsDNA-binding SOS-regulon protein
MFVILFSKFSEKCNQLLNSIPNDDQIVKLCVDGKKIRKYVKDHITGVPCMFVTNEQNIYRYDGMYDIINFFNSLTEQQQAPPQEEEEDHMATMMYPAETQETTTLEAEMMKTNKNPKILDIAQQMAAEREREFSAADGRSQL